ncbi:hypothetical protein P171DRAFT_474029 [Karstenula rhodostoma CBS 690.94]|uniref:Uncharacterized protein n=1 Tax=Karstenula rhodostoma CBS 690.94 TaxID=1392251 RepID=A0A9P4PJ54_9PLEO|nr:hypothetical protein P171DRAFT_474029 [Karstenula rhodostoma CBS 690.94]
MHSWHRPRAANKPPIPGTWIVHVAIGRRRVTQTEDAARWPAMRCRGDEGENDERGVWRPPSEPFLHVSATPVVPGSEPVPASPFHLSPDVTTLSARSGYSCENQKSHLYAAKKFLRARMQRGWFSISGDQGNTPPEAQGHHDFRPLNTPTRL